MDVNVTNITADFLDLNTHFYRAEVKGALTPFTDYKAGRLFMTMWVVDANDNKLAYRYNLPLSEEGFSTYNHFLNDYPYKHYTGICMAVHHTRIEEDEFRLPANYIAAKPSSAKEGWVFKQANRNRDWTLKHLYEHYGLATPGLKIRMCEFGSISASMMAIGTSVAKGNQLDYRTTLDGHLDVRLSVIRMRHPHTISMFGDNGWPVGNDKPTSLPRNTLLKHGAKLREMIIIHLNDLAASLPKNADKNALYLIEFGYDNSLKVARTISFVLGKDNVPVIANDDNIDPLSFYNDWIGEYLQEPKGANGTFAIGEQQYVGTFTEVDNGYTVANVSRVGNPATEPELSPIKRQLLISEADVAKSIHRFEIEKLDEALQGISYEIPHIADVEKRVLSPEVRALILDSLKLQKGSLFVSK